MMTRLINRKVLVVEDELLVAMDLEMLLHDAGCEVLGPVDSNEAALAVLGTQAIDGVVLDINLHGDSSSGFADALAAAEIPFLLLTGHDARKVPSAHRQRPMLIKPYEPNELLRKLASVIAN